MPQHQMTIAEIFLNPSVPEEDEIRLSNQAELIYEKLNKGSMTTDELSEIASLKRYWRTGKESPPSSN